MRRWSGEEWVGVRPNSSAGTSKTLSGWRRTGQEGPLLGGNDVRLPSDQEEAKLLNSNSDSIFYGKGNYL